MSASKMSHNSGDSSITGGSTTLIARSGRGTVVTVDYRAPLEELQGMNLRPELLEWLSEEGRAITSLVRAHNEVAGRMQEYAEAVSTLKDKVDVLMARKGVGKPLTEGMRLSMVTAVKQNLFRIFKLGSRADLKRRPPMSTYAIERRIV